MGTKNQISIEIPQQIIADVNQKLQECRTLLAPYLQALTADEKQSIFKMGDKTVATVQKVRSYTVTNPEFIPAYMNTEEFQTDAAIVTNLDPLGNLATQLASDIKDTVMLAGSEAIVSALLYYGTVKEAANKGIPTAQPIYADLSQRFTRETTKKSQP